MTRLVWGNLFNEKKFLKANRLIKWVVYTVLIGAIPILARLAAFLLNNSPNIAPLSAADFVAFGLVLHVSVINEIEHFPDLDENWKTVQNGSSIIFVVFYGFLLALAMGGNEGISSGKLLIVSMFLSLVSLGLGWSVFQRINAIIQVENTDG